MRHNDLLNKIVKERIKSKPTRGRRSRLQMLDDLTKGDGCAAVKQEDKKG